MYSVLSLTINNFSALVVLLSMSATLHSQETKSRESDTTIQIDRVSRRSATPAFAFKKVPTPSKTDAGNIAIPILVRGSADQNGGAVSVVQDGKLPQNEDEPGTNYFLAGVKSGRLLFDFGKPIAIKQINTYSWHPDTRADQRYDVFVPSTKIDKTVAVKSASASSFPSKWKKIASVDTRIKRNNKSSNAQIGVSIARADGGVSANTQFVLLAIEPTSEKYRFSQTFFSEIDFVGGRSYPAAKPRVLKTLIDDLVIDDKITIHFDTTQVPALRGWVKSTLMPACREWYPRITSALASDGYKAPTEFRIVFRDGMRGVAYTRGKDVYCAGRWYQANLKTEAVGSVIHELVHVVQQYGRAGNRRPPGWLVEGIADHIRWYQFEPPKKRRRINWDRAKFDAGYFPSASFLDYIVKNIDPGAIKRINADCRQGSYDKNYWEKQYRKSPERIWAEAKKKATEAKKMAADGK